MDRSYKYFNQIFLREFLSMYLMTVFIDKNLTNLCTKTFILFREARYKSYILIILEREGFILFEAN